MFNAHERPAPVPHRYAPAGLGSTPKCGVCQRPGDDPLHTAGLADAVGADGTQCPGCEEMWPIELTVRMLRFVRPDGKELTGRNLRLCRECAGMPVDDWALLAMRREKGWISEERYIVRVQELADRAAREEPRLCNHSTSWGTCLELQGHPGAHRLSAVKAQRR